MISMVPAPADTLTNSDQVSLCPHPCQHLLSFVFVVVVILRRVRWSLKALVCLSVTSRDVGHLENYLPALRISSFKKSLFSFTEVSPFYWLFSLFSSPPQFFVYSVYQCFAGSVAGSDFSFLFLFLWASLE